MVRLFFCLLIFSLHAEEPWGTEVEPRPTSTSPAHFLVRFYQQYLSPTCGPRSHFLPTSSEYMRQAISKWGVGTGFVLGCDRLLRENDEEWLYKTIKRPVGYSKYDPVPTIKP